MQFRHYMVCMLCAAASFTHASSENAWAAHDQKMKAACVKASQLSQAKVASNIMLFDDQVGYSAVVIDGIYPQKHMKKQQGKELCLWNRKTQKASVTEADSLLKKLK